MALPTVAVLAMVAMVVMTWREEEEYKKGKIKKSHLKEIKYFWEGNKMILSCLEKKLNGYHLKKLYPLVEEEKKLEV